MPMRALLLLLVSAAGNAQQLERDPPSCETDAVQAVNDGAAKGEPRFVYLLARHLSTGACMPGDGDRALALFRAAADSDYPPAFYTLGMLAAGNDDFIDAERLFSRGALLGHRGSELQLGILYMLVPAPVGNDVNAYAWLSLLSRRNEAASHEAKDFLGSVRKRMSKDDVDRADALADDLFNAYGATKPFVDADG